MNFEPIEALELRQQMDDVEERTEQLEKRVAALLADEFIAAGFFRRGVTVLGYWLFGVSTVTLCVWVIAMLWGWM